MLGSKVCPGIKVCFVLHFGFLLVLALEHTTGVVLNKNTKTAIHLTPNLSFNPDPTVGCCRHALDFLLTVGPVNFVR